jgi:hypothetical protein
MLRNHKGFLIVVLPCLQWQIQQNIMFNHFASFGWKHSAEPQEISSSKPRYNYQGARRKMTTIQDGIIFQEPRGELDDHHWVLWAQTPGLSLPKGVLTLKSDYTHTRAKLETVAFQQKEQLTQTRAERGGNSMLNYIPSATTPRNSARRTCEISISTGIKAFALIRTRPLYAYKPD